MEQGKFNYLSNILSGDNKIIIPDLQRDYCWGSTYNDVEISLALSFSKDFFESALKKQDFKEFSYGIIYTYEYPDSFLYLCDGQQRLTTLYLIAGILYCYKNDDSLKNMLQLSNGMPRLKYEVRSSTDYFITSLLSEVFISQNKSHLDNLSNANWFRNDYLDDPSVKSMVEAVASINTLVKGSDYKTIIDFFLNSIGFVYINLKDDTTDISATFIKIREYGEKMYEIVNTCGDPMENNEHKKAILLSKVENSSKIIWTERWEVWQDFFWINRGNNLSADKGFDMFLSWIEEIEGYYYNIEKVEQYFKSFFFLMSIQDDLTSFRTASIYDVKNTFTANKQLSKSILFPLLKYLLNIELVTFNDGKYFVKHNINLDVIFRFNRFFFNISRNTISVKECMLLSDGIAYPDDIILLHPIDASVFKNVDVLTEESFKLKLYKEEKNSDIIRKTTEDVIWQAEDHKYLNGRINPVLEWINFNIESLEVEIFSIERFSHCFQVFDNLTKNSKQLELIRIALFALRNNDYSFHEGWSWGSKRYYLGLESDEEFWRSWVDYKTFTTIMHGLLENENINLIIEKAVQNIEDPTRKKIVEILLSTAQKHWQWNNSKRFFIYENEICFPNGVQAKENTERIKLFD